VLNWGNWLGTAFGEITPRFPNALLARLTVQIRGLGVSGQSGFPVIKNRLAADRQANMRRSLTP
jgi:hypothetical protein